jgi:hypothetical protein
MRLLLTIPHYFLPTVHRGRSDPRHGSSRAAEATRVEALGTCIRSLHELFGRRQFILEPARRTAHPANQQTAGTVEIVVCTTADCHVLSALPLAANVYTHVATRSEPKLLGFECHAVLRERLGAYDYYGYIEDDLILHDPWFFVKLAWFTKKLGSANVLLPNRYEVGPNALADKVYLDGDLPRSATRAFQDVSKSPVVRSEILGHRITFRRALNPHAGGFFLTADQMAHWAGQPYYLDRDTSFVGPLESAASLGVMRTFRVYKPAPQNAGFLEIQHYGTAFLGKVRHRT